MPVPRRKLFHLAFQVCWHLNEVIMKAVMEAAGKESLAAGSNLPACSRWQQLNSHFFHARPEACAVFVLLFIASVEASASK